MTREEILPIAKPILFNTDMVSAILDDSKTVTRRIMKPQPILQNGLWLIGFAGWSDGVSSIPIMPGHSLYKRAPYKPGDYLYVRETWKLAEAKIFHCQTPPPRVPEIVYGYEYKADNGYFWKDEFSIDDVYRVEISSYRQWDPSIHMPKEAARIFLRVTDVRVERFQDITIDDVLREGVSGVEPPPICQKEVSYPESFPKDFEQWEKEKQDSWIKSTARARYIGWCDYADKLFRKMESLWNSTIKAEDLSKYGWQANPWVWVIEFEKLEVK